MNRLSKILAITLSALLMWEAVFPSAAVLAVDSSGTDSGQPAAAEESGTDESSSQEDPALAAAAINKADSQYFGTKLPRYQEPAASNPFYFSRSNIYEASGYGMPNCTAYAWGRAYEYYQTRPALSKYNAGEWWTDNINWQSYEFGQEPKVGAIAVWDQWNQDTGHVAFVEAIEGDNVILSESSWHGTMFRVRTIKADSSNYLYGGSYRFCGYIYVGEPYAGKSHTPGERWRTYEAVNARYSPSSSAGRWITIRSGAEIDVTETVEAEGYLWGKITYAGTTAWCILNYAVCLSNPSLTPDPPTRTLAEAENRVITAKNGVNLRYGPGTKYDVITWIPGEMVVAVTDIADGSQYTWGKTTFNGIEGWFVYDYTDAAPAGSVPGEPVPAEESSVPERTTPSGDTSAANSSSVPETSFVVEEPSKTESSKAESSKAESSKAESSKAESSKAEEVSELRVISTNAGVNMRSGPGTSNQIVGTIPYETVVLVTAKQSDSKYTWGKTSYKGKEGWFVYNYTTEAPAGYEAGMSVANSSKNDSSKAESSKAESSKAESSKSESSKAESSKAESSKAESSKAESSKAESSKAESSKPEESSKPAQTQTVDVSGYPSIYRYKTGVSDYVVILQKQLLALGYDVQAADGYFGAVTDQMVKKFQTDKKLYVDGIVGPKTWAALFAQGTSPAPQNESSKEESSAQQPAVKVEDYASYPTIYRGKYGVTEYVSKLQARLNELGYNVGPVDGYFGDQTYLQVIKYQRDQKLVIDGYVGPVTWASLFRSEGNGSGAAEEPKSGTSASTPAPAETPALPAQTAAIDTTSYPYLKVFGSGNTDYVKKLQEQLNKLGYNVGPADGIFGYQTEAQVRAFQKAKNLYVDGEVGQKTWAALYADGTASVQTPEETAAPAEQPAQTTATNTSSYPYLTKGSSNAEYVKILQNQLNKLGYNAGPADGIFGAQTEAQVRAFQKAKSLYVDGEVGPKTWAALFG